ncbi:MAG: hypothetical protein EOO15_21185, partial [Chitinophagaceae bacterium]
ALIDLSSVLTTVPGSLIRNADNDLKNTLANLASFTRKLVERQRNFLNHHQSVCRLMHPDNLLRKGFALAYADGKLLAHAADVPVPGELTIRMQDGTILAKTISKTEHNGQQTDL